MPDPRAQWRRDQLALACNPTADQAGYHTLERRIGIAGTPGLHIRALADRNQFHDPLGEAAALGIPPAAWPLFGWPWASGIELAVRVAARAPPSGERMLEVGCGLALASLSAHRLGHDVTASDLHPLTARFLAENLRLNALGPMKYRSGNWRDTPSATGRRAVQGRYGFLVGSDVLYERDGAVDLAGFLLRHAMPEAEVWIVDPDRSNRPAFRGAMAAGGFRTQDEQRLDRLNLPGSPGYKGRLMRFVRG